MRLEDFLNKDNLEIIDYYNNDENDNNNNFDQNIDFTVNNNNNLIISFNLTNTIIKNIKKESIVKLKFELSKEFYFSILNDFK